MAWYNGLQNLLGGGSNQQPNFNAQQIQRGNPQQQGGINQLLNQTLQGLQPQNFGSGFQPIAQEARNQFQQQTIPGLAERFTSMGGGQKSSAFQGALGSAASGLEQGLAAQQAQFGQNQQSQLQNLLSTLLSSYGEPVHQPSFLEDAVPGALQALFKYLTGGVGGLAGAAGGAALGGLGQLLGNGFNQSQQQNQYVSPYPGAQTNANNLSVFGNSSIQNLLRGY